MKKWIQISLSVFGILLATISFFVSEVEQYPSLLRCLCPKHLPAMKGIEKLEVLEKSQCFNSNDAGFNEVCDIAMELFKERYSLKDISSLKIAKFEYYGETSLNAGFGADPLGGKGFRVFLSNKMEYKTNNNELRKKLEDHLEANLLHWRFGLFFAGILLIQIPTLIGQLRKRQRKKS